jgi:hypothetical protein
MYVEDHGFWIMGWRGVWWLFASKVRKSRARVVPAPLYVAKHDYVSCNNAASSETVLAVPPLSFH